MNAPSDDLHAWHDCIHCQHWTQPPNGPSCGSCRGPLWDRTGWQAPEKAPPPSMQDGSDPEDMS